MKRRKIVIAAFAILAGALVLVIGASNVFLKTGLLRSLINNGPESTWVDYRSASSFWPGRVRVKGFLLRDRDDSAEWIFELEDGRLTYSVMALLRRRFHVTKLRGRGLTFRARNRLTKDAATPERTAGLPPIAGLPDPPLLSPVGPDTPRTGKEFTIHIEDISVDPVREIWVDTWRYEGEAKVTGGFLLEPNLRAEVFSSALQVRGGALRAGSEPAVSEIRGALGALIHPWLTRDFPGSKMVPFITGEADLKGHLESATLVNQLIGELPGTRIEKAAGDARVEAALDKGMARGKIALSAPDAVVQALDMRLRGKLDVEARIARLDIEKGGAELSGGHANLTEATLTDEGKAHPWWAHVKLQEAKSQGASPAVLVSHLTARARDARPLMPLLNTKLPDWAQDFLAMEGLQATAQVRFGKSLIEIRRLNAAGGKVRIQGDYRVRGKAKRGTFLIDRGLLTVGVGVENEKTELRILAPRKWFEERTGREPAED